MKKPKKVTFKRIKDTGWHEVVDYFIKLGIKPEEFNAKHVIMYRAYIAVLKLSQQVEVDMYSSTDVSLGMLGLSKQVLNDNEN